MLKGALSAVLLLLLFCSCNNSSTATNTRDILAENIDSTIKPSDDFFSYANGGWIKKNEIPAAESGWGIGQLVDEELYNRKRKINEDAEAAHAADGTITQKIGDFWYSGMDSTDIEKQGLKPLQASLDSIEKIHSINDLIHVTGMFHARNIGGLFSDYVGQDDKNSEVIAYQLGQGGLGMSNRDYYFNTDARTAGVRAAYKTYLFKTFRQLGKDSATAMKNADDVFALETKLAKGSRKLADLRDPYRNYNKMSLKSLEKLSPNIDWPMYLKANDITTIDSVIVGQPEFYTTLNTEINATPLDTWKNYLRFRLVNSAAPYLDSQTFNNRFAYIKSLSGASEPRVRWKRVADAEEGAMGEALGQLFVKKYFDEKAKQRYSDLVEAMRSAYAERIKHLTWMSDSTKQKALDKLSHIVKKVGYPDKWKDFSALKIDRGPYILNMQRANEWWHHYEVSKLGKPVDRTEWGMSPQTYNAYYNPSNNEIVLPAGMFAVPGMADADIDDAFVYGYAAASTIGHEMTHGFDDQGRQYNAEGNLKGWWQPADSVQFTDRASHIIKQFNEFMPVDTAHVNGQATQGENIADLGGLVIGIDAFKKTDTYKKGEKINGFTPMQRYFLGYAYSWMYTQRKESLASQVMTDVHAPAKERVNGPVANIPEFYEAFNVKPGDKMYRADSVRVNIW